jgi:hypothetical protein
MNKITAVVVCLMMSVWLCSCGKKAKNAAYGGVGDYYYGKSYYKPPKPHKAPKCDVPEERPRPNAEAPESNKEAPEQKPKSNDTPESKGASAPQKESNSQERETIPHEKDWPCGEEGCECCCQYPEGDPESQYGYWKFYCCDCKTGEKIYD